MKLWREKCNLSIKVKLQLKPVTGEMENLLSAEKNMFRRADLTAVTEARAAMSFWSLMKMSIRF